MTGKRANIRSDEICSWIDHGGAVHYRERFWTLDPIDGTKGFLRGEQYAVALALIEGGEVVVAALACPNLDFLPVRDPHEVQDAGEISPARSSRPRRAREPSHNRQAYLLESSRVVRRFR